MAHRPALSLAPRTALAGHCHSWLKTSQTCPARGSSQSIRLPPSGPARHPRCSCSKAHAKPRLVRSGCNRARAAALAGWPRPCPTRSLLVVAVAGVSDHALVVSSGPAFLEVETPAAARHAQEQYVQELPGLGRRTCSDAICPPPPLECKRRWLGALVGQDAWLPWGSEGFGAAHWLTSARRGRS
jgi:hypothetical protein